MRQDGPFIEAGENDNLIVQRLAGGPHALGIFGYSFLFENQDTLKPVAVDGVVPNAETIAVGRVRHLAAALHLRQERPPRRDPRPRRVRDRVRLRGEPSGPDGYLSERGLIPLGDAERDEVRAARRGGHAMDRFN